MMLVYDAPYDQKMGCNYSIAMSKWPYIFEISEAEYGRSMECSYEVDFRGII